MYNSKMFKTVVLFGMTQLVQKYGRQDYYISKP